MVYFKTIQVEDNLRELVSYSIHSIPLTVCNECFDDFFQKEWRCHWHDEFEFGVVLKGTVEYTFYDGGKEPASKELHQGDGIFINTGCLHSARGLEPGTVVADFVFPITFFDIKFFENISYQSTRPIMESGVSNLVLKASDQHDQPLLSAIAELCAVTKEELGYELHYVELVCRIWRLLTVRISHDKKDIQTPPLSRAQEQRLKEMISYIRAHFSNRISINDMAKSAGISRTESFRCFQTILKKTPLEYLNDYRLSVATMLLANSDRTLSDIAYSCGFSSPGYFSKLFREQCGQPPKKYRDQVHSSD